MDQRNVRVVVGRGGPSETDIRATLEDDGFQVAGEASSVEELARLVQADPPDVVVLDDTIGVAAAQVVQELAPEAKLIVIWPAAVLPIAGATRIDAGELRTALAPAVAAAAGIVLTGFTTIERPEWIDTVRKDPATLREMLDANGGMPVRPSVTELQRPHGYPTPTGWRRKRSASPAVVAAAAVVGATSVPPGSPTVDGDAVVNRRLGIIALGGAVAAGALMIALSFGRTTPPLVTAEPYVPGVSAGSNYIPDPNGGTTGQGPGMHGGTQSGGSGGTTTGGTTGGTTSGSGGTTSSGGSGGTTTVGAGTTGGGSGNGTDVRTVKPSANRPGTGGGGGQGGGGGGGSQPSGAPGNSGDHNPHGGPPGQTGDHPGNGNVKHPSHPSHPSHRMAHTVHRHKR
jgi:hypothetical protein